MKTFEDRNKLTDQFSNFKRGINYDTFDLSVNDLVKRFCDGEIENVTNAISCDFEHIKEVLRINRDGFVESVFLGIPKTFHFVKNGDNLKLLSSSFELISVIEFVKNYFTIENPKVLTELKGFDFNSLPTHLKERFCNTYFRCVIFEETSKEIENYIDRTVYIR